VPREEDEDEVIGVISDEITEGIME